MCELNWNNAGKVEVPMGQLGPIEIILKDKAWRKLSDFLKGITW